MLIKKCMSLSKIFSSLLMLSFLLFSARTVAQQLPGQQLPAVPEYSDEQLIAFVNIAQKIIPLQQESQEKMVGEIEEENLTVEQFNNIMNAFSAGENVNVPEQELESFNKALEGIQEIQIEYEEKIISTISEEGMEPEKYSEIIGNYQRDPELQMRVNALFDSMLEE
jgi:hypothetical protein